MFGSFELYESTGEWNNHPAVTAVVSTYNAEKFMRGRMEDLINQTLFKHGELEIIVIDAHSPQNEKEIVLEYLAKYPRIKYVRTPERELISASWNRGCRLAKGRYLTNANTDDRLLPEAYQIMADYLDKHSECVMVHADQAKATPEEIDLPLVQLNLEPYWRWPDSSRAGFLISTQAGSQPMWRSILHKDCGWFDERINIRLDQDFFCRVLAKGEIHFIPRVLGIVTISPHTISRDVNLSQKENQIIFEKYTTKETIQLLMGYQAEDIDEDEYGQLLNDLGVWLCIDGFGYAYEQITKIFSLALQKTSQDATVYANYLRYLLLWVDDRVVDNITKEWDESYLSQAKKRIEAVITFEFMKVRPQKIGKRYPLSRLPEAVAAQKRPLYIWGSGGAGLAIRYILEDLDITIKGFIDNSQTKWGYNVKGLPVFPPTVLQDNKLINDKPYVIIGSMYKDEIEEQLIGYGLAKGRDYWRGFFI